MFSSLYKYLCEKFFSKPESNSTIRKNNSIEQLYGKRLKLSNQCSDAKVVIGTAHRLPMHSKENVEETIVQDDDDGCCVIAEIPRKKDVGCSLMKDDKNKEIEIIKYVTGNEAKTLSRKPLNQTYKFFNTQRTISQSKITKSQLSYRNNLKSKLNYIKESYYHNEKLRYIQLLRSQTSFKLVDTEPHKFKKKSSPCNIPLIDLTDETCNKTEQKHTANSLFKTALPKSSQKYEDFDIQIVEEIPRVKSFEDVLKITPSNSKEVLQHSNGNSNILKLDKLESKTSPPLNNEKDNNQLPPEALEVKLLTLMQITEPVANEVGDRSVECTIHDFTPKQEIQLKLALKSEPGEEILAEGFGLKISRRDMQTLKGLNWLNDEVINFYMNLIMKRSREDKSLPKVYAFNTFFFTKLVCAGYSGVQRWTKQVDIFSFDILLVPIHLGMHWCLSVIDFRHKSVCYYDSVGSPNESCLKKLLYYLKCESIDKKKEILRTDNWSKKNVEDIPQQMNGSDCGVFLCMFAECLARDGTIIFTQENMPYFRKKIIIEILNCKLLS